MAVVQNSTVVIVGLIKSFRFVNIIVVVVNQEDAGYCNQDIVLYFCHRIKGGMFCFHSKIAIARHQFCEVSNCISTDVPMLKKLR